MSSKSTQNIVGLLTMCGINFIANSIAMNKLVSSTNVPLADSFTSIGSMYLNPFSFLVLYIKFNAAAPKLFELPLMIVFLGFACSIMCVFLVKQIGFSEELTSEGTAKWATHSEIKKEKALVKSTKTDTSSGAIVGTWYSGVVDYESLYEFVTTIKKVLKRFGVNLTDKTFWKVMSVFKTFLGVKREYIIDNFDTHAFICAASRSGKGIGIIIPTLLHWKESMVVSDLKRENIRETGAYRKYVLGHNVLEFAPTDTRPTARFNPLNEIRWGTPNEDKDVENLVTLLVGQPEGKDAHWKTNAISLIIGAVTYLKYEHTRINNNKGLTHNDVGFIETNLYHVYEFLTTSLDEDNNPIPFREKLEDIIAEKEQFPCQMYVFNSTSELPKLLINITEEKARTITTFSIEALKTPLKHPKVINSFSSFTSKPDNEGGSVLSTAITALSIFSEKIIVDNTCTSDFIVGDIRCLSRPTDLFLVVPPSDLARVEKLFTMIFTYLIDRITENEEKAKKERKCMFLIDEWPAFGRMDSLVKKLGYIASYGLKTVLIVQGVDQVKRVYENKIDFLGNCQVQVFFEGRDESTPKYVSEKLGKTTIEIKQVSSDGSLLGKRTVTKIQKGRYLLDPAEVASLSNTSVMVLGTKKKTLKIKSPKNKWFLNDDLVEKLNHGKQLDPNKHIGLRDVDITELPIIEDIRWHTDFELDREVAASDIRNAVRTLANIAEDDVSTEDFLINTLKYIHMKKALIDARNGYTILDKEYVPLTMFVVFRTLNFEPIGKIQSWIQKHLSEFKTEVLHIEAPIGQEGEHTLLGSYDDVFYYFSRLDQSRFEALKQSALQAISAFKNETSPMLELEEIAIEEEKEGNNFDHV